MRARNVVTLCPGGIFVKSAFDNRCRGKIGLALGGGGARGLAHLGVWQSLVDGGIGVSCIAGTSIGAIAGAVIAAGRVDKALEWCMEPDWRKIPPLLIETNPTNKAIASGRQVEKLLSELIGVRDFSELGIPFAAVATDLHTGDEVTMREGDLLSAVRASMSIPGVFKPVERDGRVLIDGQLVDPVPVRACREMGAEFVIAVDVNPPESRTRHKPFDRTNIVDVLVDTLSIFNCEMTRHVLADNRPDMLIRPDVGDVMMLDFRNGARLIELGREAAERMVR